MSANVALWVLAWLAIIIVYLGLSAVLREVRMLRGQVARLAAATAQRPLDNNPQLPPGLVGGVRRVVVASDSRCPLCRVVLARLGEQAATLPHPPILLTHEDPQAWADVPPGLTVVRDEAAWRQIAHLTPPILMDVAPGGSVIELVLPSNEKDVDAAVTRWSTEGVSR